MTRVRRIISSRFRVAHQLDTRVRLTSNALRDPALDSAYVSALVMAQDGVRHVRINSRAASIVIDHDPLPEFQERILDLLNALPVEAYAPDLAQDSAPDLPEVLTRVGLAGLTPFLPPTLKAWLSWIFAAPTMAKGVETLITDGLKVEVLDGSVKALSLLRKDYLTVNILGAMLCLAEYVEHSTEERSNELLAGLLRPQVETIRVRRNGADQHIPFDQARIGDKVLCGSGEMVPVDGKVIEGETLVNTSSMTGESVPRHVAPGDEVLSGAMVEEGTLMIEAASVGAETSTARIAGYMERSLRSKSTHQERKENLADKLVPLTFGVAGGVFVLTGSLARAASVLTVDYSCAVKLSTPVAVRAAMYRAGSQGVLLKGAQALENLAGVDTMVFDKTGTLTLGALEITDVLPLETNGLTMDEAELLSLAAGAEEHYSHPVAAAVVAEAKARNLALPSMSQVDFVVAHGVSAMVQGERVIVGSRHFIHDDENIDCSKAESLEHQLQEQGKNLLYVAKNDQLIGLIAMRDTLRPETPETLQRLKALGVNKLVMLTGDQQRTADAMHAKLPELDEIHAQLAPEDKARIVDELSAQGRSVAFVGDGVNDAPALLTANVGISMPSGADLARDAAQVLLLKEDLSGLVLAKELSQRTETVLKQCLWSSVTVNSALLGLSSLGLIPAVASAALHNGTTIATLAHAAMGVKAAPPTDTPAK